MSVRLLALLLLSVALGLSACLPPPPHEVVGDVLGGHDVEEHYHGDRSDGYSAGYAEGYRDARRHQAGYGYYD